MQLERDFRNTIIDVNEPANFMSEADVVQNGPLSEELPIIGDWAMWIARFERLLSCNSVLLCGLCGNRICDDDDHFWAGTVGEVYCAGCAE